MRPAILGLALLAAGCGGPSAVELEYNQLAELAGGGTAGAPRRATGPDLMGLQPLTAGELRQAGLDRGCGLVVAGQPLLAAAPARALVKRNGALKALSVEGPVGGTGGFFAAQDFSVSVGRLNDEAARGTQPVDSPGAARIRLTDRATGGSSEFQAYWSCTGRP